MLSKVRVDKTFPNVPVIPALKRCMEYKLIPDSTYYSNGSIIINDKADVSYIYDETTNDISEIAVNINLTLSIPNPTGELFHIVKPINVFDQNNIAIAQDIRNTVMNYMIQYGVAKTLLGIGGEYYLYYILLQQRYKMMFGLSNNKTILSTSDINCANHECPCKNTYIDSYTNIKNFPVEDTFYLDENCGVASRMDVIVNLSRFKPTIVEYLNKIKHNIGIVCVINCNDDDIDKMMSPNFRNCNYKYIKAFNGYVKINIYIPH